MDLSNENVIHKKSEKIEYLQFRKLMQYPEIRHAYVLGLDKSFKIYPNSTDEKNKIAIESYKQICKELKLDYKNIVNTNQNHTDNIQIIDSKINQNEPDFNLYENTDGLITKQKDIVLSTINADCILLIFYDPIKKVIANIHSGWRGTIQRISVKAVKQMQKEYGSNPEDIICCMSPSIRKDHFEVDIDVYEQFEKEFKEETKESAIFEKNTNTNKWHIDTIEINRAILKKAGLKSVNIIDSGICSMCNKDIIHSYRANGENAGRATLIIGRQ